MTDLLQARTPHRRQPLIVAVTGHRDLVMSEIDGIRDRVRTLFRMLQDAYPELELRLMSPLAEGADQLAAEVAVEMNVPLDVPLPMPVADYLDEFDDDVGTKRFHSLYEAADSVLVLSASDDEAQPTERYARLGTFLASHCHVLLAIWDGKHSDKLGGTSQVVRFHHDDIMPGYAGKSRVSQQMLIDDESDLVFHIVCSRDRPDGAPVTGLEALDWCWFTKDEQEPRSKTLPAAHRSVLQRANEFSADAQRFAEQIKNGSVSLVTEKVAALDVEGLTPIDMTFCEADFLAIHYQRKSLYTLRVTHVLAFAMGALFILYSELATRQPLLYLFLLCFGAATLVQGLAARRGWFRKYLDYRTLAEGLRVQFYWALAGVAQNDLENYSYDEFLQLQDPEVGWIRNTMRVAGTETDAIPHDDGEALGVAVDEWVGDGDNGQLGYYTHKALERTRRRRITDLLGRVGLLASAVVVIVLLFAGTRLPPDLFSPMLALMGVLLLLFAVRHAYAHAIAESELIKQYEFMLRIFANAGKCLETAGDDRERRQILMVLGRSALDEHAQWIMMHRERSLDQAEIWRLGSGS
jgi:hypothetical protein